MHNRIVSRASDPALEECPVSWCEGHHQQELGDFDDLVHSGRTVAVELPVGKAHGRILETPPAHFEVHRASSMDDGEGLAIRLNLESLIAPFQLHDFAEALRNFADYLEINGRVI